MALIQTRKIFLENLNRLNWIKLKQNRSFYNTTAIIAGTNNLVNKNLLFTNTNVLQKNLSHLVS